MTSKTNPDTREPLARHGTKALAYPAMGATFFLETLTAEDEPRLQQTIEFMWEWFGMNLKWCVQSFNTHAVKASLEELEYIPTYASNFPLSEERFPLISTLDEYSVYASSGSEPGEAGLFQIEFYGGIDWAQESQPGVVRSVLGFCVADTWDILDFEQRVRKLTSMLSLRWGIAGHRYAYSDVVSSYAAGDARWAHAQRYWGYDLAEYAGVDNMHHLYDAIPSVNWLTWLGPDLTQRVQDRLEADSVPKGLTISKAGSLVLLRAGDQPQRGDINRLEVPDEYVAADRLLRSIRLNNGEHLCIPATKWSPDDMTRWLQRFERS